MSGHSHWAGIKHQKEITDKKRAVVFSKLLIAVSVAAKTEPDLNFNPRLRTAVSKAKEAGVPAANIERAIKRASVEDKNLEDLIFEAYGPGGAAILIVAASDNSNRAVSEVKNILNKSGGKWAESGSVRWAFEQSKEDFSWSPKFPISLSAEDKERLSALVDVLLEHDSVQEAYTNAT